MIPSGIVYVQKRDFDGNLTSPMPCLIEKIGWAATFLRAVICKDQEAAHLDFTTKMAEAKKKAILRPPPPKSQPKAK